MDSLNCCFKALSCSPHILRNRGCRKIPVSFNFTKNQADHSVMEKQLQGMFEYDLLYDK